jgi:glycosyltransferase involved in cell wall biosynthesis
LLLEGLTKSQSGGNARLTIVGDGPERGALELQAERLGIANRVRFAGPLRGDEVWAQMHSHKIMVVPSVWDEPFGIVALEGLACGCRMIVAKSGGLPEAVGSLALTFPRGDAAGLADCLDRALSDDDQPPSAAAVTAHLARFRPERIAADYLAVLKATVSQGRLAGAPQPL